jgi:integrase
MSAGHIRPRGPRAWELKYDIGRDPKTEKRITRYATVHGSKTDARRKLRELLTAVDKGEHVDPTKITLGEHVRARIQQWPGSGQISTRTAERYTEMHTLYIVPHLGRMPIQKLTTAAIEKWHTDLRVRGRKDGKGGLCSRTIRQTHRLLAQALGDAFRHNLVVRNVAQAQKPPRGESNDEVEIIAGEQITPMLSKLQGDPMEVPSITALYTGMRRGEQLALRWPNVDLDAKVIRVREALEETKAHGIRIKAPKSRAGRRDIGLPEIVVEALREHRRQQLELRMALGLGKPYDDAIVFPGDDGGYQSPRAFSTRWGRTVERLGLPDVTWHALRHTHASQLIDAGVDIVTISKRLGHAKPDITLRIYAHLFRQSDSAAAAAINAALAGQ